MALLTASCLPAASRKFKESGLVADSMYEKSSVRDSLALTNLGSGRARWDLSAATLPNTFAHEWGQTLSSNAVPSRQSDAGRTNLWYSTILYYYFPYYVMDMRGNPRCRPEGFPDLIRRINSRQQAEKGPSADSPPPTGIFQEEYSWCGNSVVSTNHDLIHKYENEKATLHDMRRLKDKLSISLAYS